LIKNIAVGTGTGLLGQFANDLLNNAFFGDEISSPEDYAATAIISGVLGGAVGPVSKWVNGKVKAGGAKPDSLGLRKREASSLKVNTQQGMGLESSTGLLSPTVSKSGQPTASTGSREVRALVEGPGYSFTQKGHSEVLSDPLPGRTQSNQRSQTRSTTYRRIESESATRNSVLANIAKSRAARLSSRFPEIRWKYDMMRPGPLSADIAGTFAGGRYSEGVIQPGDVLWKAGNSLNPGGSFFNFQPPKSIAGTRIDNAVRSLWIDPRTGVLTGQSPIDSVISARFPVGTKYYYGRVGNQGGIYVGGEIQVHVPGARRTGTFNIEGSLR
jgi:hypothetical protein